MEDAAAQSLEVQVRDSHLTGRTVLGHVMVPLRQLPADCTLDAWLPVDGVDGGRAGEIHLQLTYKVQPLLLPLPPFCSGYTPRDMDILPCLRLSRQRVSKTHVPMLTNRSATGDA